MYILKIAYLLDGSWEETEKSAASTEGLLKKGEYLSEQYVDLTGVRNFGRCCVCRAWASDKRQIGAVAEMSNGAEIDGKWYCDVCLPKDHLNAF